MPVDLKEEIQALADAGDRSMSKQIVRLLREALAAQNKQTADG